MELSNRITGVAWDNLQHFTEIANTGAVRKAAKSLGVSPPTISRSLRALEDGLQCELFVRDKEGLSLTEHGEQLLEHCRTIDAIVSQVRVRLGARGAGHEIRISSIPSIGQEILIPYLENLRGKYPNVQFTLNTSAESCDLDAAGIDIALRAFRPEQGQYIVRKISSLSSSCYARRVNEGEACPARDQPLVVLGAKKFDARLRNSLILGLYPNNPIAVTVYDFQSLVNAVRAGLGQGLLPDFVAQKYHDLALVPDQEAVLPADVWIIVRDGGCRRRLVKDIAAELSRVVASKLRTSSAKA
jgi:DNA-binding transcriptional LysR family regulator